MAFRGRISKIYPTMTEPLALAAKALQIRFRLVLKDLAVPTPPTTIY